MKRVPRYVTEHELSRAYAEGKRAFEENKRRGYNPYVSTKQELAMEWWHGWDTGQEENRKPTQPGKNTL